MPNIYLIDDEYQIVQQVLQNALIGTDFTIEAFPFRSDDDINLQIERCLSDISERTDIDLAIVDIYFKNSRGDMLPGGRKVAKQLYSMGIPVIIMSGENEDDKLISNAMIAGKYDLHFMQKNFGSSNFKEMFIKTVKSIYQEFLSNPPFEIDNQKQDDSYSLEYDKSELQHMSTLFAIKWENQIIMDTINKINHKVKILDIGCGTGRFEELLLRSAAGPKIERIIGVDYSQGMLSACRKRFPSDLVAMNKVSFHRMIAERLPDEIDGINKFDMIIMGFGVPSFVKGYDAFKNVYDLLKPGGFAVFTVYNKDSFNHEFRSVHGSDSTDFCAVIKYEKGDWWMGPEPYWIKFRIFKKDEICSILRTIGFQVYDETISKVQTFPTLCGCRKKAPYKIDEKRLERLMNISYDNDDPLNIGFDQQLYQQDLDFCRVFKDSGYYLNIVTQKTEV